MAVHPARPADDGQTSTPRGARRPASARTSTAGASAQQHYRQLRQAGRTRRRIITATVVVAAAVAGLLLTSSWVGVTVGALWGAGAAVLWLHRTDTSRTWAKGAAGERKTARLLGPLERRGYTVLHDRAIPRSRANIDHLVITPAGTVIVVDSKNWARKKIIKGGQRGGWVRVGRTRGDTVVGSALYETRRVREELARALGAPVEVQAVLAVHGGKLPSWRRITVQGVPLLRARQVPTWITSHTPASDPVRAELLAEISERTFPPYQEPEG
ncbi:nuclease-related domain-containing protein [Actinomadura kijaniata]|uniref:nuclease-related domain-containing protein n=1 Tax=Actinomadura kijaniata TaxID=46161 RepID=UPI001470FE02|nr:nuclease-related domain-containing protein [Actinomadura kijaniata]